MGNHLLHPLWLLAVAMASATHRSCERRDGDCPPCQPARSLSPTAAVTLSDKEPELVASAKWAESVLTGFGNRTDIIRFDNPTTGLHTSLFYFCCHTVGEVEQMLSALGRMEWKSVTIDYDTAGCNLDHDNHTVYIHAMPKNQAALFALAKTMEDALTAAGVPVNHPRKSLFHMTLARVTRAYPVDAAVESIRAKEFGTHRLCEFTVAGQRVRASDC